MRFGSFDKIELSGRKLLLVGLLCASLTACAVRTVQVYHGPEFYRELSKIDSDFKSYVGSNDDGKTFDHLEVIGLVIRRVLSDYIKNLDDVEVASRVDDEIGKIPRGLSETEATDQILTRFISSLDSRSKYINAKGFQLMSPVAGPRSGAIGIQYRISNDNLQVMAFLAGSPAPDAGLKINDLITSVDEKSIEYLRYADGTYGLPGPIGTDVHLNVVREGQPPFKLTIRREFIDGTVHAESEVIDSVLYIKFPHIEAGSEAEIRKIVKDNTVGYSYGVSGIIVDLRSNGGGILEQAVSVANDFLPSRRSNIATVTNRNPARTERYDAVGNDIAAGRPIVALINQGTASGAELIAAAWQDNQRATILGTRSQGYGAVETVIPLPNGGAAQITTGFLIRPDGEQIEESGIKPNDVAPSASDGPSGAISVPPSQDSLVQHALTILKQGATAGRPAGSN